MRRLNVQATQLEECVERSMHALPNKPTFEPGELLLLQLTKTDAAAAGKLRARIEHVLEFDHLEPDSDGSMSREHWPDADRTWPWIVFGKKTLATEPFSLEDLPLSRSYVGQANAVHIDPVDEAVILPYVLGQPGGVTIAKVEHPFATPEDSALVDEIGMEIAVREVGSRFPGLPVVEQPHNNPGFDILVGPAERPTRYVEVKSTRASQPVFNLSEWERRFSHANADNYSLIVVVGIDIATRSHASIRWRDGAIDNKTFQLRPLQWRGRSP